MEVNMTIEEMFNECGVKHVFNRKGYFTKWALDKYEQVADTFFPDDIDAFDQLCSEENCFEDQEV